MSKPFYTPAAGFTRERLGFGHAALKNHSNIL